MNWKIRIRSNIYGAGVALSSTYVLPQGISLWGFLNGMPKNWPWGWVYLKLIQRRQKNTQQWRKRGFMAAEAAGEGEE